MISLDMLNTRYGRLDPEEPAEQAFAEAHANLSAAEEVKADISFSGIFANFIKKMDDTATAAQ